MALEFIKLVKGDSPVAQVGSLGFFKLGVESSGGGGDFDRVFGNNTPEQIAAVSAEISANNMTSEQVAETYGWNIGDTIDITLTTGEVIQMRIIGINHNPDLNEKGITLEMVNCLAKRYTMNDTSANAGGWGASQMRTQTLPTIKTTLPVEWQNIIKKVDKKSANGSGVSNFTEVVTTSDDLFLLSEIEVFATTTKAQNGGDEGSVYEYWNGKTNTDRIKMYDKNGDGVPETIQGWWLRSVVYDEHKFCWVGSSGAASGYYPHSVRPVSFAFCI